MIETLKYFTLIYKLFYQAFYDAQISLGLIFLERKVLSCGTRRQVEIVIVYCLFQRHGSRKKNYISGSIRQKLMIETLKYFTLIYKLFYQAFYDAQISLG